LQVGKSSANRASKAANKKAATAAAEEGSAALIAVFSKGSKALEDLRKVGVDIVSTLGHGQLHKTAALAAAELSA
jgi:predicted Fe-Mo cluster-binding NifX family protein